LLDYGGGDKFVPDREVLHKYGELKRAIVRFGNRLTEEKDEPESIQEKDEAQAADDQEKLQSPFRED